MNELRGLDAWITGGRYSSSYLYVTCNHCGESDHVICEREYGQNYWTPEECKFCGEIYDEKTAWEEVDPKEEFYDEKDFYSTDYSE